MKFEIQDRYTGKVKITAEIEATEETPLSVKIGLAARWAIKHKVNLIDADLIDAKLIGANLSRTNLSRTNLSGANLSGANLIDANLSRTNLIDANLIGANLSGANLGGAIGNMKEIRSMQLENWPVTFTKDIIQIGCKKYTHEEWKSFTDQEISKMNDHALEWWKKWKDFIFKAIELSFGE